MPACTHTDQMREVAAQTEGCEECLATGQQWVARRLCLTCGHVGCCDSSPGKHATAHFEATGHPIMRSFESGKDWTWCYLDKGYVD